MAIRVGVKGEADEFYCLLCGEIVENDEEEVILNTDILPKPYICRRCIKKVVELSRDMLDMDDDLDEEEE